MIRCKTTIGGAAMSAALLAFTASATDQFPGIEGLMSEQEFSDAGLEKLSPAEIEALEAWLVGFTAGEASLLRANNEEVKKASKKFEVLSTLDGEFRGWSGGTIFSLSNGQRWQQRLSGRYDYDGPRNPSVRISRNWAGYYRMTIVETGKSIGVSPIIKD